MYLYSATGKLFSEDVLLNRIAEKLKISFVDQLGRNPGHGEINAWRNSLQSFAHLLSHFGLQDVGVVLNGTFCVFSAFLIAVHQVSVSEGREYQQPGWTGIRGRKIRPVVIRFRIESVPTEWIE